MDSIAREIACLAAEARILPKNTAEKAQRATQVKQSQSITQSNLSILHAQQSTSATADAAASAALARRTPNPKSAIQKAVSREIKEKKDQQSKTDHTVALALHHTYQESDIREHLVAHFLEQPGLITQIRLLQICIGCNQSSNGRATFNTLEDVLCRDCSI